MDNGLMLLPFVMFAYAQIDALRRSPPTGVRDKPPRRLEVETHAQVFIETKGAKPAKLGSASLSR